MKKQIIPITLAILMVLSGSIIPVNAAEKYGRVPILIGDAEADYVAEQILSEIPLTAKTPVQQIQEVYDWMIYHCTRYASEWDGTLYYDQKGVKAILPSYKKSVNQQVAEGKAVVRKELESYFGVDDSVDGYSGYSLDSNSSVATMAKQMMLKRNGDCARFSAMFAVLAGHLGYDCHIIAGDFINSDGSTIIHKWNYMLIDGKYYWFDIRIDHSIFNRNGYLPHYYFMVEDTGLWEESHEWNHAYSDVLAANAAAITNLYSQEINLSSDEGHYDEVDLSNGSMNHFSRMNTYIPGQFHDVSENDWYAENVKDVFEYGLMIGNDNGNFGTGDRLTIAQTLAIADRLHNRYYGGSGVFNQGNPWYQVYLDYALEYRFLSQERYDLNATATRAQFAKILSDALPDDALQAINQISNIPDVNNSAPYADSVYRLYNAGILTGNDQYGTFGSDTPIKREEVAAMATRFANEDLRKQIAFN